MTRYNNKQKIIEHYDYLSPYYRELWGEHLHHGFWEEGTETKEEAQLALTVHLAKMARVQPAADILDVGCGFGGSSIYLAKTYNAAVTGMTLSPVQATMAREAAIRAGASSQFLVMDAESIALHKKFDLIWSIESISHFSLKDLFFRQVSSLLKPGGTLALIDWFKRKDLSVADQRSYIAPIERGMLVELKTVADYIEMIGEAGLTVTHSSDLSDKCSKTWDICANIITNRALWRLAGSKRVEFIRFLQSFNAMRNGFASGCFIYGMLVAHRE